MVGLRYKQGTLKAQFKRPWGNWQEIIAAGVGTQMAKVGSKALLSPDSKGRPAIEKWQGYQSILDGALWHRMENKVEGEEVGSLETDREANALVQKRDHEVLEVELRQ